MMRIKSLSSAPDRGNRYRLVFEDDSVMRLYRQTVEDFGLYPGLELSDEQLQNLRIAAGQMSAKMRAVRIVAASSVSKGDLERRLVQKGEDPTQAKEAVAWMSDMSLLDDGAMAQRIVARCISKGYGRARAKQVLYEKRIPKEFWDDALRDYPEQLDKIMDFLEQRLPEEAEGKDVKRVIDALIRRGHSYSAIRRAMQEMAMDSHDLPEV
jgi:regulatory protein